MDRAGYKAIYSNLLDIGSFNGLSDTPIGSVMIANFVDAISIMSLKNTGI